MLKAVELLAKKSKSISNCDLMTQIIKKIALRVNKIDKAANYCEWINFIKNNVLKDCCDSIKELKNKMMEHFKYSTDKYSRNDARLDFLKISVEDIQHDDLKLAIEKFKSNSYDITQQIENSQENIFMHNIARNLNCKIPNLKYLELFEKSLTTYYDIESWVRYKLNLNNVENLSSSKYLLDLLSEYIEKGLEFYKNDPYGYSRLVLTSLKIGNLNYYFNY